jgi:hypothetical protein
MSSQVSSYKRPSSDHFQPDESLDPQACESAWKIDPHLGDIGVEK